MRINCRITIKSNWQYLPWQHINGRITLIQKKISEATKQNNLKLLYKAQNFLLNSNEARLFVVDKIINNLIKYYRSYSYEHYLYKDIDKFYLFKYLFNTNFVLKTKLRFIVEQVKEYLIYLCLEPEWNARSNLSIQSNVMTNDWYKTIPKATINNLNWNKLIYHTKSLPYINEYINYWTSNKFFIRSEKYIFEYLQNLLLIIYNLNIQWYDIKTMKWRLLYSYKSKKLTEYSNRLNTLFIKRIQYMNLFSFFVDLYSITSELKSQFYEINYLNKSKLNKKLQWKEIMHKTNLLLYTKLNQKELIKYSEIMHIIAVVNFILSSLNIGQNNHHILNLLNHYKFNLFNMLYKKTFRTFLYKYLFKVNR